jgi:hypothetical protein
MTNAVDVVGAYSAICAWLCQCKPVEPRELQR